MPLGPIDPFQNIVGIGDFDPDIALVPLRFGLWLTRRNSAPGVWGGVSGARGCHDAVPPDVVDAFWGAATVAPIPLDAASENSSISSDFYRPQPTGSGPAKFDIAIERSEKAGLKNADSLEDVELTLQSNNTGEIFIPNSGRLSGLVTSAPLRRTGFASNDTCAPFSEGSDVAGLAWKNTLEVFPDVYNVATKEVTGTRQFHLVLDLFTPDTIRAYEDSGFDRYFIETGQGEASGVIDATWEPTDNTNVEGDLNLPQLEVDYEGDTREYAVVMTGDDKGSCIERVIPAEAEVLADDSPMSSGEVHFVVLPFALVVRYRRIS